MTSPISKDDFSLEAEMLTIHINSMLIRWGSEKTPRTGLHASSVLVPDSEWCSRRHVLANVYPEKAEQPEPKPWDAHQNAVFLHGWAIHEKWQNLFKKFGTCIETETPHYDETRELWFTPDALYSFAGQTYVIEVKGYKSSTFVKLGDEPPEAAMLQCNLYCHLLGLQYGVVLVENKDDQDFRLWMIERNAELARKYTDRMYEVKGATVIARSSKRFPARVCGSPNDRLAQKCPMRKVCFSSEDVQS